MHADSRTPITKNAMVCRRTKPATLHAQADVQLDKIVVALERFHHLLSDPAKLRRIPKSDLLYHINHFRSPFSNLIIGKQGQAAFEKLVPILLGLYPSLAGRIETSALVGILKHVFSKVILRRMHRTGPDVADVVLHLSFRFVRRFKLHSSVHFLPCIIFDDTMIDAPTFSVGGCTFLPTSSFFASMSDRLNGFIYKSEANRLQAERRRITSDGDYTQNSLYAAPWPRLLIRKNARYFVDRLEEHFNAYNCVARIEIGSCSDVMSDEKAIGCLTTALNILRLLFSPTDSQFFRVGGTYRVDTTPVHLAQRNEDDLRITILRQFEGAALDRDEFLALVSDWDDFVRLAGSVVSVIAESGILPSVCRRIVDALTWFGEAVVEPHRHTKVVRYANALETFLVTEGHGVTRQIEARGGPLCLTARDRNTQKWRTNCRNFYEFRSELVHGEIALDDPRIDRMERLGHEISSRVLINGMYWMHWLFQKKPDMSKKDMNGFFENELERFCEEQGSPLQ